MNTIDGQYHTVHVTYKGVTKDVRVKAQYTVYSALARACMAFKVPDEKWVNVETYLKLERTGEILDNSLMICETEVCEGDKLELVEKDKKA